MITAPPQGTGKEKEEDDKQKREEKKVSMRWGHRGLPYTFLFCWLMIYSCTFAVLNVTLTLIHSNLSSWGWRREPAPRDLTQAISSDLPPSISPFCHTHTHTLDHKWHPWAISQGAEPSAEGRKRVKWEGMWEKGPKMALEQTLRPQGDLRPTNQLQRIRAQHDPWVYTLLNKSNVLKWHNKLSIKKCVTVFEGKRSFWWQQMKKKPIFPNLLWTI